MDRASLIRRIEETPGEERAWEDATRVFAGEGDFPAIHALLHARHGSRGDAGSFALRMAVALLVDGAVPGVCAWLYGCTAPDSAFRGPFAYAAGMEAAGALRLGDASALLREGVWRSALALGSVFQADSGLCAVMPSMMRDANLIEPPEYDAAGPPETVRLPELVPVSTAAAGPGPLVTAACDWTYFRRYRDRFLGAAAAGLGSGCGLHLHVVNPGAGAEAELETLARTHPGLGLSRERGPSYKVYYAACRFLIAERLMTLTGRDLVTVDLDGVFGTGFGLALERAQARDLDAAFLHLPAETSPACRISAAFLYVRNSAGGRRFLARTAAYLMRKLAEDPVWMIDQAALLRTVCLLGSDGAGSGRFGDVNDPAPGAPGGLLPSLVEDHLLPEAVRRAGREPFGRRPLTFTPALKPVWQPPFSVWEAADGGVS